LARGRLRLGSELEPDLLGEAMVQRALAALEREGEPVPDFLDRVFEGAEDPALLKHFKDWFGQ
jgi:hypothetical protein